MNKDMEMMLRGYGLTTAQIFYRLPDHPLVLQTYVWQNYDLAHDFPEMHGFLKFWQEKLDGPALRPLCAPTGYLGTGMARAERGVHPPLRAASHIIVAPVPDAAYSKRQMKTLTDKAR